MLFLCLLPSQDVKHIKSLSYKRVWIIGSPHHPFPLFLQMAVKRSCTNRRQVVSINLEPMWWGHSTPLVMTIFIYRPGSCFFEQAKKWTENQILHQYLSLALKLSLRIWLFRFVLCQWFRSSLCQWFRFKLCHYLINWYKWFRFVLCHFERSGKRAISQDF